MGHQGPESEQLEALALRGRGRRGGGGLQARRRALLARRRLRDAAGQQRPGALLVRQGGRVQPLQRRLHATRVLSQQGGEGDAKAPPGGVGREGERPERVAGTGALEVGQGHAEGGVLPIGGGGVGQREGAAVQLDGRRGEPRRQGVLREGDEGPGLGSLGHGHLGGVAEDGHAEFLGAQQGREDGEGGRGQAGHREDDGGEPRRGQAQSPLPGSWLNG